MTDHDRLRQTFALRHARTLPENVTSGAMLTALAPDRLIWKAANEIYRKGLTCTRTEHVCVCISRLHACTLGIPCVLPCRERRSMHVLSRKKDHAAFLRAKLTWRCTRSSLGRAMLTPPVWPACRSAEEEVRAHACDNCMRASPHILAHVRRLSSHKT